MMSDSTPLKGERDSDFQAAVAAESAVVDLEKDSAAESDKDVLGGDFDDDIDGPTSSVNNIIPMDKLKNGWFVLSSYMQVSVGGYFCGLQFSGCPHDIHFSHIICNQIGVSSSSA